MGLIQRQSLKAGLVNYVGAFIGIINTFFLFTLFFSESEIGQLRYIQEIAILLASFASLGFFNVLIRFFPEFKTADNKNNGILTFAILVLLIGLSILAISLFCLKQYLSINISSNIYLIFGITSAIVFGSLGYSYSSNFGLVSIPSLFKNLYIKIFIAILGVAYFFDFFDFNALLRFLFLAYLSSSIFIIIYLYRTGNFKISYDFSFFKRKRLRRIFVYSGFGLLGTLGSGLANKIDIFMISDILNFSRTGVYTIALNASNLLMIPVAGVLAVSGPIIVKAIRENDLKRVEGIYKKAGLNLFLFGSLIMVLLWGSIDSIFELIPNGTKYKSGKIVVLILGLAKLFDMLTSINELIISYSRYFRFNLYSLFALALFNILANLILIPHYDITGAAMATFMSIVFYNIFKTVFIYLKFRVHPFNIQQLYIAILSIIVYTIGLYMPVIDNPFLSIIARSFLLFTLFTFITLKFNISPEATDLWSKTRNWVLTIFRK